MFDAPQRVVNDLTTNLTEEIRLFEELRETLETERSHLVDLDVEGIDRCTRAKEGIAQRHRRLEEARLGISGRFEALSLPEEALLSEVARAAAAAGVVGGDELDRLRARLSSLIDAVREMNDLNRHFVAHSLTTVQGAVELIHRAAGIEGEAPATYGAGGEVGGRGGGDGPGTLEVTG